MFRDIVVKDKPLSHSVSTLDCVSEVEMFHYQRGTTRKEGPRSKKKQALIRGSINPGGCYRREAVSTPKVVCCSLIKDEPLSH